MITEIARKKFKKDGGFDGRYAPRSTENDKAKAEKYHCREDVEVPSEEGDFENVFSGSDEGPSEYEEEASFNPISF